MQKRLAAAARRCPVSEQAETEFLKPFPDLYTLLAIYFEKEPIAIGAKTTKCGYMASAASSRSTFSSFSVLWAYSGN